MSPTVDPRLLRLLRAPRLGVYGGSFDPAHLGHRAVARAARRAARLDAVVFVPAARSPHKQTATAFGDAERLELLRLLREREPGTGVWTFELERPPPSYTVETLERLRELRGPQAPRPFLILGEDQLAGLPRWREPQRVWQLAEPLIVQRGPAAGFEQALADADRALPWLAERLRAGAIQVQHPHPASGTSIRAALALGDPPPFLSAAQLRALRAWSAAPPGVG